MCGDALTIRHIGKCGVLRDEDEGDAKSLRFKRIRKMVVNAISKGTYNHFLYLTIGNLPPYPSIAL